MKKSLKRVKCVLTQPIRGQGGLGDIVNLRSGYARYLERFNKATRATKEILENIEAKKEEWRKAEEENLKAAEVKLDCLKKFQKITLYKRVSHAETLYSAVKSEEIIKFFAANNISLTKENIKIDRLIKTLGEHLVIINVYGNFEHSLVVEICKEG